MRWRRFRLLGQLTRMVWRHRLYFFVPFFVFLLLALLLLVVVDSPALIPFFYTLF
jgi:hypothetical protein